MNDSKQCSKCGEAKPRAQFSKGKAISDGLRSECKSCQHIREAAYRERNRETLRADGRSRRENDPARRALLDLSADKWKRGNREKVNAQQSLNRAILNGGIVRGSCARAEKDICSGPIHGHHEDYSRPLEVVWLCCAHHHQRHAEIRKEAMQCSA